MKQIYHNNQVFVNISLLEFIMEVPTLIVSIYRYKKGKWCMLALMASICSGFSKNKLIIQPCRFHIYTPCYLRVSELQTTLNSSISRRVVSSFLSSVCKLEC